MFSLSHSTTSIVRVMNEVRIREEEYITTKKILSRVRGLPDYTVFVTRDRRLLSHGPLEQIFVGRNEEMTLDYGSPFNRYQSSASDFNSDTSLFHMNSHPEDRNTPRQRSNSLNSSNTSLSEMNQFSSSQSSILDNNISDNAKAIINDRAVCLVYFFMLFLSNKRLPV